VREQHLLADADVGKGSMEVVNITHSFELHLMAVRCNSSIAHPHKYVKFRYQQGRGFLPKGAIRLLGV
jgi:hypothetical protein